MKRVGSGLFDSKTTTTTTTTKNILKGCVAKLSLLRSDGNLSEGDGTLLKRTCEIFTGLPCSAV